jgi:hypothetical protein
MTNDPRAPVRTGVTSAECAGQGDEADLGAGERVAGFFVEDDAFDDCGVECRPGRERQQEEE